MRGDFVAYDDMTGRQYVEYLGELRGVPAVQGSTRSPTGSSSTSADAFGERSSGNRQSSGAGASASPRPLFVLHRLCSVLGWGLDVRAGGHSRHPQLPATGRPATGEGLPGPTCPPSHVVA